MNILRKLSTLVKAMVLQSPGERPAETVEAPQQDRDADLERTAMSAQQAPNRHADAEHRPLDRSRVADLLEQQEKIGQDTSTQRKKGDRS